MRAVASSALIAVCGVLAAFAVLWSPVPVSDLVFNIRWVPGADEPARQQVMRDFDLTLLEVDDRTWAVQTPELSRDDVQAIVQHPLVEDTHDLDRANFSVPTMPRARRWLGEEAYDGYVAPVLTLGRLPFLVLGLAVLSMAVAGLRSRRVAAWLAGGVPHLSRGGLTAFRVVFGGGLLLLVALADVRPLEPELQRSVGWLSRTTLFTDLSASAGALALVQGALVAALAAFVAGLVPRVSLLVSAALFTLLTGAIITTRGAGHEWGQPMVAVWLMTLAPWHEGHGLSSLWRRRRGRPAATSTLPRGLAVWLPGVAISVAFAAAAFAKLDESGIGWITNGAVRYHFIEDAASAPVDWGLWIAASAPLAVLLSLGGVVVEAGFWIVNLFRQPTVRATFGLAALGLLSGFALLQGVFWPGWWLLCLAFLPWSPLVDSLLERWRGPLPAAASAQAPPLGRLAVAVLGLFVLLQVATSAFRFESEPLVSDFAMYADSWSSPEAFDDYLRTRGSDFRLVTPGADANEMSRRLQGWPNLENLLHGAILLSIAGEPWPELVRAGIDDFRTQYARAHGESLDVVEIVRVYRRFDWEQAAFTGPRAEPLGLLDFETGTLGPAPDERRSGR